MTLKAIKKSHARTECSESNRKTIGTALCTQLQEEVSSKEKELQKLLEVCKRKQQPTEINTQKKQKTQHDTNSTKQSSNIDQDTNIECELFELYNKYTQHSVG